MGLKLLLLALAAATRRIGFGHGPSVLAGLVFAAAIAHAGPVPMCGTQFQYDCVSLTLGGYTVITTLGSTGQTEITGYSQSSSVVFDQVIPIPPTGPAGNDVQEAVLHADALIALQSGQASTLPSCCPLR